MNKEKIDDACPFPPEVDPSKNRLMRTKPIVFKINNKLVLYTVSIILIAITFFSAYFFIVNLARLKVYIGEGNNQLVLYDDELSSSFNFSAILSQKICFDYKIKATDYAKIGYHHEQKGFSSFDEAADWLDQRLPTPQIVHGIYRTLLNMNMSQARLLAPQAVGEYGEIDLIIGNTDDVSYQIIKNENSMQLIMKHKGNWAGWNWGIQLYKFPDRTYVDARYLINLHY